MSSPKHETTIDFIPEGDTMVEFPASLLIVTTSYLEEIASIKKERERRQVTSSKSFLADVFKTLEPITNKQAHEVTIRIVADKWYEPKLISSRYIVERVEYGKKG